MRKIFALCFLLAIVCRASAQTEIDALMMEKNAFCIGPMYTHSSWKSYWEGTLKRENLNLGRVSTSMYSVQGNYGLSKKINLLFGIPYVTTKASAGTMQGQQGLQDLNLFVKWKAFQKTVGSGKLAVFAIGGVSFPVSDYVADYLPLSIGLRSKTVNLRLMADYNVGNFFGTVSGIYSLRSNVRIDRDSYYTTEMHYTNEVEMPNAAGLNVRAGFRNHRLIAEVVFNQSNTLGGFDITRNNMPFPSNRMNSTMVGANFKYTIPPLPQLQIVAGGMTTIAGRNVGQSTGFYASFFYVMDLSKKEKKSNNSTTD